MARRAFDPADRSTWGQGGTAPLLIDPCRSGSTHALVFGGPGGFKTTSVGIPTMLTWSGSAVVLDPSREIAPMVRRYRQETLGHHVVTLDLADPAAGAFNVLDWIDITRPEAETNVEAAVNWICGEIRGQVTSGAEFIDVSAEMVRQGAAWVYRQYNRDPSLLRLEQEARDVRRRLWALPEAERTPPWQWRATERTGQDPKVTAQPVTPPVLSGPDASGFTCGSKRYCRDMTSCAEARFYLTKCGLTRLDADGDGVPCESICR